MSLTLALNNALTGLNVSQRTMAAISNNIANANTEGYSRQVVDLASVTYDGTGAGVRVEDIVRKVDEYLRAAITRQTSDLGKSDILNEFMERSQILLGDPSNQSSVDAQIETFFNSLQSMAETPERTSSRAAVIESAVNMSREISNLSYNFQQLRFQADIEISQGIEVVNAALKKIYTLNEAVAKADAFGTSKATLFDQRDLALNEIAQYMDVRTYEQENGVIHVYVGSGISLVDDSVYEIGYNQIGSLEALIEGDEINPITLHQLQPNGTRIGNPIELVSSGIGPEITRNFTSGKLVGLLDLRDKVFPEMIDQMDVLAGTLRDTFNEIHNKGAGYPAASELTGTRSVTTSDRSAWSGSVRIALLDKKGLPIPSPYAGETSGVRPLNLDLATLYNGVTTGEPDLQTIIDEINNHYGIPQNQLRLGNLNQVQLALSSDITPGGSASVNLDFDVENISGTSSDFWVNNIQILDDTGTDITSTTNTLPAVALNPVNTFTTTLGSNLLQIATAGANTFKVGDRIRLDDPLIGGGINGIPSGDLANYFEVVDITGTSFIVRTPSAATAAGSVSSVGQLAHPPYATIDTGDKTRLRDKGTISASLSGNINSSYYDVNVTMAVRQPDGTISNTIANYRMEAPEMNTRNDRISARTTTLGGGATLVSPNTTQGYLKAIMVDENGVELPKTNNEYGDQVGFLKIVSLNPEYTVAIDELDSKQLGLPSDTPPKLGSNRGFSHYFELNNFFSSNTPTDTGDTRKNSALYLSVEERFRKTPSLISTGNLERSSQPANPNAAPLYTYERLSGDNSLAQALAKLGITPQSFAAAGGLADSNLSFNGYAGEMIGYMSTLAAASAANLTNSETLLKGYSERSSAISGVNLDEELANTIIYQNAYTASAKVITVTDELFQTLLQAF